MNNLVLLTGTVASPDDVAEAQRLVQAYVGDRHASRQPAALGDPAAGQPQGPYRRSQPQPGQADRRQPAQPRQHAAASSSASAAGQPAITTVATPDSDRRRPGRHWSPSATRWRDHARPGRQAARPRPARHARPRRRRRPGDDAGRAQPDRACRAKPPASSPAANSRSRCRRKPARSRSNISNMASAWPSRRSSSPTAASRCASVPRSANCRTKASLTLNGFNVPALTTRRAETTVELGSGQSFMIAGLLRNANTNNIDKAPFLGDLPILGALFRSTNYRRAETELVIIVTPYLVRPVSGQLALPTDGYRAPTTGEMVVGGQTYRQPAAVAPTPVAARRGRRACRPGLQAVTRACANEGSIDEPFHLAPRPSPRRSAPARRRRPGRSDQPDARRRRRSTCRSSPAPTMRSTSPRPTARCRRPKQRGSTPGSQRSSLAMATRSTSTGRYADGARDDVARVAGNYGLLVGDGAPVTAGRRSSRAWSGWSSSRTARVGPRLPQLVERRRSPTSTMRRCPTSAAR